MAVAQGPFLAAVLLLISSGLHRSSPLPACPEPCTCQGERAPLLNCSSTGLSSVPHNIQDSVTELDLSHNLLDSVTLDRPLLNLRNVWLGNNSVTHLSLCVERNLGSHYVRSRPLQTHRLRPRRGQGCVSWAPTLQLLSVERNQLEQLPQGLEGSKTLQVLQLSFNRISTLQAADLSHLRQLKELHLQHNLITSLHPQMFQDLAQLQVLDLSFNMLTSLHPLMYLSLRNIGADVRLGGNRWQCDCSMRSLRRRMAYDSSRGLQAWSMVCASPSVVSGRDLLQLEEDDLNCFSTENGPELHRDVTVYRGSEILLSCATQDSLWWTPSGQASVSQPQAGLVINDITERDTGLYVCVSEEHKVVSVFNLQISKIGGARRKTRGLPRTSRQIISQGTPNTIGQERNQRATQSDLALAVCLSIFITFLIAFILGVLARPCIDVLWKRFTKKSSSPTNSVSSVEQRQYDNEAYFNGEEPEHIAPHRERRVTFSTVDYREDNNVKYYDTVAGGSQENMNNHAVIECEAAEVERDTNTAGDSGSENSLRVSSPENSQRNGRDLSGLNDAGCTHSIEFEHIPDPVELVKRRSSSSCSDSSLSDNVLNADQMRGDHSTPKSHQLAEDSVQQRAESTTARKVEVPQISIEGTSELPGLSSEHFADWSPHTNNTNLKDPDLWQENEEVFEFSDSVRSTSARSSIVHGSFNDSKLIVAPTSDKGKRDDMSSSSSYVSEDEPTQYTVNSDQEEEEDTERNHNKPEITNACLKQDASFGQQNHPVRPSVQFNQDDFRYVTQKPAVRPEDYFSSQSSDSDGEDYKYGRVPSLAVTNNSKRLDTRAPSPPAAYSSSSSSESEAEITDLKVEHLTGRVNDGIKIYGPETVSTDLDDDCIPQIKRHGVINAPLPASDSSSSDEGIDETTKHIMKKEQREVDMVGFPIKEHHQSLDFDHATRKHLDIRAPSPPIDSSSSSDTEDDPKNHTKRPGKVNIAGLPFQASQTGNNDADTKWPVLDLEHIPHVKRRLDIKAPSPPPDSSSSSDTEDETTNHIKKQEQGQMNMERLPSKVSQTVSHDPQLQWPVLDLEDTTRIKSHLDIKAPLPASDSSSSSDSDDEKTHHTERPGKVDIAGPPFKGSQTGSHDADTRWPVLDLEHIPHVKRRLDIKAPSPPPDSSSSSDTEDEMTNHIKKQEQGQINMERLPSKVSQTVSHDPQPQWPIQDLEGTTHIKRHLDLKAPSPASDSSSSSDSDDEKTHHTERPGKVDIAGPPFKASQTGSHDADTRWPVLDLEHIPHVKMRLDIKAPSPPPDSSSSSDSDDEKTHHTERLGKVDIAGLPFQGSQTGSHDADTRWPVLDLEHIPHVKRRLDIQAPSPPPDSSSSSDSEDEMTNHIKKQEQGQINMERLPSKVSQTVNHDPQPQWPVQDLEGTTHIKRHLDIKAPSRASDSSLSSDSEDETTHHTERPGKVDIAGLPFKRSKTGSHDADTRWPVLDLEHIPHVKRRLDIKAPSPPPDSSSSSDTEDETTNHIKKQEQGQMNIERLPSKVSQTVSHDPQPQWPVLDLEDTTRVKRRLDIKAPSPASDSSSSSDSEDETTHHTERPGKVDIAGLPFKRSKTGSHDPDTRWPVIDLEHIPHVKRRLDIQAPSPPPDSSSSSDSENEMTNHIKKQEQGQINMERLPSKVSQTLSHDPQPQWPVQDLEGTTHIKRHLDIKAPSPASDSSSSSDSEDETTHHTERPGKVDIAGLPFKRSKTGSHDADTRWPVLDLEHIPHIKRRLDIKAPSPPSNSSSSSDTEDEMTNHIKKKELGQMNIERLPSKVSRTVSHDLQPQWPVLDLEHIPHLKRRLDIKAPSPPPGSSSSSDSEDETSGHIEKQSPAEVDIAKLPFQKPQPGSHDADTRWPVLDLENIPHVKRRLDIKAPSPASNSSTSSDSDSEDETTHHTKRPGKVDIVGLPSQGSQTGSHDPDTRWPLLDLEHIPHLKRRLDIKEPSPPPGSSSSSDSEDETSGHIEKQSPAEVDIAKLPFQKSQPGSHDADTRWPVLDLENIPHVKRRLDIKAPSPVSDSSSSSDSDSEDETTHHTKRPGKVDTVGLPSQGSQTGSHDPDTRWPLLDLEHIPHLKRRLDIKAPSPPPGSSSSSDSEDETSGHIEKQSPAEVDIAKLPFQKSQPGSHDADTRWPVLDLENIPHVKRRLDIKAPSPVSDSSSSSDSDSEDETTHHTKRPGKVDTVGLPSQGSQTGIHDPDTRWPSIDLVHIPRIKRHLDIKAPSPPLDSLSNCEILEEKIAQIIIHEQGEVRDSRHPFQKSQAESHDPERGWPVIDLEHTMRIKRRLDIKAASPASDSSSSSDSEDETTHNIEKSGKVDIAGLPFPGSQTGSHDPDTTVEPDSRCPVLDLSSAIHVKRRLDIKAHSPPPESSSSSDHESEGGTTNLHVKMERDRTDVGITSYQPARKLPDMNMSVPPIKRHLNIKGPSQPTDSCSSRSDSEDDYRDPAKLGLGVSKATEKEFIRSPKIPVINISHNPKTDHKVKLEKYTVITDKVGDKTTIHNISTTPEINPELQSRWATMNLGFSRFRKRVDITSQTHEPPNLPSSPPPDSPCSSSSSHIRRALDIRAPLPRESSSSSNSEDETVDHSVPVSLGVPRVKRRLNVKASIPEPSHSPSSCSESENEVTGYTANQSSHASNMSGMTDNDALITYKRLIIKPSPPSDSFSPSGKGQTKQRHMGDEMLTAKVQEGPFHSVGDRNASLAPKRAPRMSFDDLVKKRIEQHRRTTDVDLPPEITWTGIGRQLSDHSIPSPTRNEEKKERKGLNALKAMSSERRKWDTLDENKSASPLFDDHSPQGDTRYNYHRSQVDERRATYLSYGIPHYRRHDIGDIEPPQGAPPPIPATPPPYEAVGLTWRSSQSSKEKRLEGTASYQSRNTGESHHSSLTPDNLAVHFDSSNVNISEV